MCLLAASIELLLDLEQILDALFEIHPWGVGIMIIGISTLFLFRVTAEISISFRSS